jgi:hypothetical protein
VGFGVPVQLVCQAPSPEEYQTTILWDKIIYKGLTGYINDYNLNTPSRVQISGRPFGGVWAGFGGVPVCP